MSTPTASQKEKTLPEEKSPSGPPETRQRRLSDKELAKLGLMVSMGVLVVSGFSRTRSSRKLHLLAGGALIGLSVWHHMLYAPKTNKGGKEDPVP